MDLKEKKRKQRKEEGNEKERTNWQEKKTQSDNKRNLNVIECESIRIGHQKHNKMIQCISS